MALLNILSQSSQSDAQRGSQIARRSLYNRLGTPDEVVGDPLIERMVTLLEAIAGNTAGQPLPTLAPLSAAGGN